MVLKSLLWIKPNLDLDVFGQREWPNISNRTPVACTAGVKIKPSVVKQSASPKHLCELRSPSSEKIHQLRDSHLRPHSHRTRNAIHNAMQANGTCCQWECSHCSKQRQRICVPCCVRVASRVLCDLGLKISVKKTSIRLNTFYSEISRQQSKLSWLN